MTPRAALAATLLLTLAVAGCGGGGGKRLYPVEGTVKYEDGSPAVELAGGTVSLESVEDLSNAAGEIQKDGTFHVRTPLRGDGAPAGTYRVLVQPAEGRRGNPIDAKYGRYATSGIEITVKDEPNKVEVKVQRKGK
jgi:hypothetical protein